MMYQESTLLRIQPDEKWIRFHVRTRKDRWGHSFYCFRDKLLDWLQSDAYSYLEMDGGDFLRATQYEDQITLDFYWLNHGCGSSLSGRMDTVYLRKEQLLTQTPCTIFSHKHKFDQPTCFDFSHAQRTLQRIASKPQTRRALCKALRERSGGYCGERVTAYNDFASSFYLITAARRGAQYNGGLILHEGEKEGHKYVYYAFHT